MAELSLRFAKALAELALESGSLDTVCEQALFLLRLFEDEEWGRVILHPHLSAAKKREFLNAVFPEKLDDNLEGLLALLIGKNRETIIKPVLSAFIEESNRLKRKTVARVVSATTLRGEQLERLRDSLCRKLDKQVEIIFETDEALIGGFYILLDGRIVDYSVRRQIGDLKKSIIRTVPDDKQA